MIPSALFYFMKIGVGIQGLLHPRFIAALFTIAKIGRKASTISRKMHKEVVVHVQWNIT